MSTLPNLEKIAKDCRAAIANISLDETVHVDKALLEKIVGEFIAKHSDARLAPDDRSIILINKDEQSTYVTIQELRRLVVMTDYLKALHAYLPKLDEISQVVFGTARNKLPAKDIFELLPADGFGKVNLANVTNIEQAIQSVLADKTDRKNMTNLLSKPDWSGIGVGKGRHLERPRDWMHSPVLRIGGMTAAANAYRAQLCEILLALGVTKADLKIVSKSHLMLGGENVIYYGAPGTGKSRTIKDQTENAPHVKTIFHPDMQNSDFVGSLKPVMSGDNVKYEFSPGPFAKCLALAKLNPGEIVYLIIEELNRALPAAVFGELFLLLDRDSNGSSEYSVDFPNDEFQSWLESETDQYSERISIPSNLSIFATMNSADQGVYPVDTAFRRRWYQEYMPIDFSHKDCPKGVLDIVREDGTSGEIQWVEFASALNKLLSKELGFAEDRLLGPWWVTDAELALSKMVPGKLLIYLWDDLLRHEGREVIFASDIDTYGELAEKLKASKKTFSTQFLDLLEPEIK